MEKWVNFIKINMLKIINLFLPPLMTCRESNGFAGHQTWMVWWAALRQGRRIGACRRKTIAFEESPQGHVIGVHFFLGDFFFRASKKEVTRRSRRNAKSKEMILLDFSATVPDVALPLPSLESSLRSKWQRLRKYRIRLEQVNQNFPSGISQCRERLNVLPQSPTQSNSRHYFLTK